VVLNLYSYYRRIKKHHPCLRSSDRYKLTLGGLTVLSYFRLDEGVLILVTWATIASGPAWPFHLFTDVFAADVTSVQSRLDRYSILNCCFHRIDK
jgi:hypothetical protein